MVYGAAMNRITPIARILLGLGFAVFSINFFVPFLPMPKEPPPPAAMEFVVPFMSSHFLTLVKVIELASAILLLTNFFVPLALALLAPIIVGIIAFHALLEPSGLPIAIPFLLLELILAYGYRSSFAPMLQARTAPTTA